MTTLTNPSLDPFSGSLTANRAVVRINVFRSFQRLSREMHLPTTIRPDFCTRSSSVNFSTVVDNNGKDATQRQAEHKKELLSHVGSPASDQGKFASIQVLSDVIFTLRVSWRQPESVNFRHEVGKLKQLKLFFGRGSHGREEKIQVVKGLDGLSWLQECSSLESSVTLRLQASGPRGCSAALPNWLEPHLE